MERWACVDVPGLPLQVLLRREPGWVRVPAVVIDVDRPQGRVTQVNAAARRRSVRPGMRYAAALAVEPALRAGVVDAVAVEEVVAEVVKQLRSFSPVIEPSAEEPGVLWLDVTGIEGVFDSLQAWADGVVRALAGIRLRASVAVGFDRFGTYALARAGRGAQVVASPEEERVRSGGVSLDLLQVAPRMRAALDQLGVTTVAALRQLPEGGLLDRFGSAGQELQKFVSGTAGGATDSLVGVPEREPVTDAFELDPGAPPLDAPALLQVLAERLPDLCAELVRRGQALRVVRVRLALDDTAGGGREYGVEEFGRSTLANVPAAKRGGPEGEAGADFETVVRPAAPTLDVAQILDLLRLRFEGAELAAAVVGCSLEVEGVRATRAQLELFGTQPRRDLAAANRAFARIRAEFGDSSVRIAALRDAHLPEGSFRWQPLTQLMVPERPAGEAGCEVVPRLQLVRRIFARPGLLPRDRREPDGWFAAGLACGPVQRTFGPYVVSGGWWRVGAQDEHRAYHFAETGRGDLLWIFQDRRRRRWFCQGVVD